MYALLDRGLWAEREREVAWADKYAWQFAEQRELTRARKHPAVVAQALWALAAWIAPPVTTSRAPRRELAP